MVNELAPDNQEHRYRVVMEAFVLQTSTRNLDIVEKINYPTLCTWADDDGDGDDDDDDDDGDDGDDDDGDIPPCAHEQRRHEALEEGGR